MHKRGVGGGLIWDIERVDLGMKCDHRSPK